MQALRLRDVGRMGGVARFVHLAALVWWVALAGCASPRQGPAVQQPPVEAPVREEPTEKRAADEAAFKRGVAALEAGRYSEAIPELYTFLETQPEHLLARYNLGLALLHVRSWEEAMDVLTGKRAGGDLPRRDLGAGVQVPQGADADYLQALGTAYHELRRFDSAVACFDAALAADPDHLMSRYGRALALESRGDLTAARSAWRDYVARDPGSSWGDSARQHLAQVESRLGVPKSP